MRRLVNSLINFIEKASNFLARLASCSVVAMMLLVTFSVVMRYVFRSPIVGLDEITAYLLLACAFFAAAYTLRVKGHISVDIIVMRLSKKRQAFLSSITSVLSLVFIVVFLWGSCKLAAASYAGNWHSEGPLEIWMFPVYLLIPIGCLFLLLQDLIQLKEGITCLRGKKNQRGQG